MERSIQLLNLAEAPVPIPDYDPTSVTMDPYQIVQVHDFRSVGYVRMDEAMQAASPTDHRALPCALPRDDPTEVFRQRPSGLDLDRRCQEVLLLCGQEEEYGGGGGVVG